MNEKANSNRRDFFSAAFGSSRSADCIENTSEQALNRPVFFDRESSHLETYSRNAMACQFELLFNMHQFPNSGPAALSAFDLIENLESQMTVYDDSSEVSYINENAAGELVDVDPGLFELLKQAQHLFQKTGGAFDITTGPLSDIWGFSQRHGRIPNKDQIDSAMRSISFKLIELDENTIRFKKLGVKINLGGIGKGYALDRAADLIVGCGIPDFVFHGGQSSVVARGTNQTDKGESGWNIGLSHPVNPGKRIAEIRLHDQALGTSGTLRQGFFYEGKRFGHILDPRTGYPTDHFLSSTVVCPNAAKADALATAFFVMKLEEIQSYCESDPQVQVIIVKRSEKNDSIGIESFNVQPNVMRTY